MKKISYLLLIIWLSSCSNKELEQLDKTLYENTPQEVDAIIINLETMPQFVGGTEALLKYLQQNNQYTRDKITVEGTVFVSFIVTSAGKIMEVQLLRGFYEPYDKEAIRMVKKMPDWLPGEYRGQKTKTRMTLPIRFRKESLLTTSHTDDN